MVTNYKYPNNHDFEESMRENGELSNSIFVGMTFNDIYEVVSDNTQQGGMGRAILCKSKIDEKYYVLKTYINKKYKNQFNKEIEFALNLEKNPYTVYTQTALQEEDKVYMVMELVGKQPTNPTDRWKTKILKNTIQELTIEEKYRYAIEFCKGMQYLNTMGLKSHRDIKPENIFITEDNHIKIADFGLVGLKDDCSGTEGYRSPEQAKGEETNIQSDIYSFGVVLYEIFNGGKNPYNKTRTNLKEEDFILKEYEKEHPSKNCREIIQKCGEKEQLNRYKDFKELEKELLKEAKKDLGNDFEVKKISTKELTAEDCLYKGFGYGNLELYITAIEYYDLTIKLNSKFDIAYSNRGTAKQRLCQYEEAIEDYNKAIKLDSKFINAYNNLGNIKCDLKQYKEAVKNFNKVILLDKKFANAYYNKGNVAQKLKCYKEAIKDYNKAIELNPKHINAYINRGNAKLHLNQYEEAIKDFNKIIELNPKYIGAYIKRGMAKENLKRYEEAIKDYDKEIELKSNSICYDTRGLAKCYLKQYKEAIKDFNKAIELNHKDSFAYKARGTAKYSLNQYKNAIKDYNKVLELNAKDFKSYFFRGMAKEKLKKYKEAIKDYNKAIELKIDFVETYKNLIEIYKKIGKEKEAKEVEEEINKIIGNKK